MDLDYASNSFEDDWKPHLLRVRSRRGKGRGANTSGPLNPNGQVATTLGALSSVRPISTSSATTFFDTSTAAGENDTYTFRGDTEASFGTSMQRSVFLGENFERAMCAGRSSVCSSETEREFLDEYRFLELVEGLVDRVLSASLQIKGWQVRGAP